MALNAFLKIKGQTIGKIESAAKDGLIKVIATQHEIISPRDPQSGLSTGQRMHKPFIITKELDKSTPLLFKAVAINDTINEFLLSFFRAGKTTTGAATETLFYTVRLVNASIASITHEMLNNTYSENSALLEREKIAFTYASIEWTIVNGGITTSDTWEAP